MHYFLGSATSVNSFRVDLNSFTAISESDNRCHLLQEVTTIILLTATSDTLIDF
jgi:hypothetical protein